MVEVVVVVGAHYVMELLARMNPRIDEITDLSDLV